MEIDKQFINNLGQEDPKMIHAFKPEYEGQNIKNNIHYIKFKESIIKKFGKKARIFYCKRDKIYFYYDDSIYPYLWGVCPLCKWNVCYYCSSANMDANCCLKKRIYYLFNVDALIFFDSYPKKNNNNINFNFNDFLPYACIPYLNSLVFFGGLHVHIYKLRTKIKSDLYYDGVENYLVFESYINGAYDRWNIFLLIVGFDIIVVIVLSVPFLFLDIMLTILLILISIPFKFYPLKYLFGIGFQGIRQTIFLEK